MQTALSKQRGWMVPRVGTDLGMAVKTIKRDGSHEGNRLLDWLEKGTSHLIKVALTPSRKSISRLWSLGSTSTSTSTLIKETPARVG